MRPVYGNDCLFSMKIDGVFYPLLCATDFTLNVDQDVLEATTKGGTGLSKEFKLRGLYEWDLSLNGITKVSNEDGQIAWFYVLQDSIRGTEREVQLLYNDEDGNVVEISGVVVIPNMQISSAIGDFANGSISFKGTGSFMLNSVISIESNLSVLCEVQPTITATLLEDATTVTISQLTAENAQVLWVSREGTLFRIVNGTPGNREVSIDYTTGVLSFRSPGAPDGEGIEIGWQIAS